MTALSITTFTSERFVTRLVRACFYESPRRQRAQQRIEENRRGVKSLDIELFYEVDIVIEQDVGWK